ncbi:muts domain V [Xylariales sp. PMI_506]|nr:muts domain V [Xylariales sp. PMI_506]
MLLARGKKTRTTVNLADLPQGPIKADLSAAPLPEEEGEKGPAYPTVVLQARQNMVKFENCVLLTRVGGFYELYFNHAEEYGPLLNLKVATKKTNAGPVSMAGFPFFQLDRFLKILVQELNCYVAIAEEFPNDAADKVKSNGLMHDRRVSRVITPGTLIDENFIDPYANNYVMAIHLDCSTEVNAPTAEASQDSSKDVISVSTPIGLSWLDISTGQFYTQSTTIGMLSSILSRLAPREIVIDKTLQSQEDHVLFSILAEDKHLITYTPHTTPLPLQDWTPMLESDIPPQTVIAFTPDEVKAGSLLLQYVRDRLLGMSMKLQPPMRHESLQVLTIDKNSMRSLEIRQTIRDGAFRGSLLHAIRQTVTKSGARLLSEWLSAPSTSLETITQRQDLVEYFIHNPDLRDHIVQLLRRSHDSQRLVQKFAFGKGNPDDLIGLASTIKATEDIVRLLSSARLRPATTSKAGSDSNPFAALLTRISLSGPSRLASRIRASIDEEGMLQKHALEDSEAGQLLSLATDVVSAEGTADEASEILPKTAAARLKKKTAASGSGKPASIRDHYADDNLVFTMKPSASAGLRDLHAALDALLEEKVVLGEALQERFAAPSLTLRWTPNLGHICHVRGKDARANTAAAAAVPAVSSSRSTRAFHLPEWTHLGQRIHQTRFQITAEEARLFADLRALVVRNLVKLRRNAAVLDELDICSSFARLAVENDLVRPRLVISGSDSDDGVSAEYGGSTGTGTIIIGGRHPTVEGSLRAQGRTFTANDCLVGAPGHGRLWLITGPNMAGKSTYLRQNALIAVLAQVGCYVPAAHAELGIVDAIYSRVGSADNLYADQSTFMVEMLETAQILRAATPRSLVIMDEVGRGTTPGDGTAVAFASLWHLATVNRCRALFATHFHDLADMVREKGLHVGQGGGGQVEFYCTDVEEDGRGGFVYVHKLRKGVNRESHALKVARLAGLPEAAVGMAKEVLEQGVRHSGGGKGQSTRAEELQRHG